MKPYGSCRLVHAQKNLFGDQFDRLAGALVDADPAERAKALTFLEAYLDDCMKPLAELKKEIVSARIKANRANRAMQKERAQNVLISPPRTGSEGLTSSNKRMSAKEREIASIEAMIAAP